MDRARTIELRVNGRLVEETVEPRLLLTDFLRHQLGLTGTHVGCEQGVCGACTVLLDGEPIRACLTLACQVGSREIETVEGLAEDDRLHPLQQAFLEQHGLQCGFCTPGVLMSAKALLARTSAPTDDEIRTEMSGNLCRCTGYVGIVDAIRAASGRVE